MLREERLERIRQLQARLKSEPTRGLPHAVVPAAPGWYVLQYGTCKAHLQLMIMCAMDAKQTECARPFVWGHP